MAGGPPDAPTNLTLNYNVPNVDLTWVAPSNTNGQPIIGYKIETSLDGINWSPLTVTTNTNVTYSHTNPTAGSDNYYKVSAINSLGTGVAGNTASVFVGTPPDAPTGLTVTPLAGKQHQIDWVAPAYNGGLAITNYEIERSPTGVTGTWATVQQVGNVLTWTDNTGLTLGDTYYYQVKATNSLGNGPASNVGSGLTGDKPDAVTNVTADALVNYEINLNWAPANENFYALTVYTIFASENGATPVSLGTVQQAQTTYLHQGLNSGSVYEYNVVATNALGTSTSSNLPSTTAGDIPSVPSSLIVTPVVPSQLDVAWGASSANGYSVTYNVDVSTDSGATWTTTTVTAASQSNSGLVNGQNYQYRISATNALGTSGYTATVSALAGDVPSQVVGLSATPLSATELTVGWGIPNDNGYTLTGYKVERSPDGSTGWTVLAANHQTNTYTDTGLTASTQYHYRISAINGLGTGAVSSVTSGQTYGVPNAVSDLTLSTVSTGQINLSWTQPALNGYPFTDYTIESSFDGVVWNFEATTTNTTYQDTGLVENGEHHYRITTQNAYGSSVAGNAPVGYTLPTPTLAITTTVQSDTQIDLVWNNVVGLGHSGFLIEQSVDSGITWTTVIADTGNQNLSYNVTSLTPLTEHQFRVSTINPAGTSTPSPVATATTFGHPEVPTGTTATALPGSQIQLDWAAPTVTNGSAVTSYQIERSTDGGITWGILVASTGNVNLTYTDTGLTTTQEYQYRISAINTYGTGNPSAVASAIASDVPSQVTGLTATPTINYTVDLAWTTPNGNGYAVSGYLIERSTDGGTTWSTLVADTSSTATAYADINLATSTNYTYKISAINVVGTGLASATVTSTAGDVPDSPVLTLTALPSNIIQLDWTVPNSNGFAITTYQIERSDDSGATWTTVTSVSANTFQDTGLTNSVNYQYRVLSTNQVGNSAFSSVVSMIAGSSPGLVDPLTAVTTSNTSIDLSWSTPSANGYAVSGYMIERSTDAGNTWTTIVADTQNISITYSDTGLTVGTMYTYKVSGINSLGTGPASNTATTHAGDVPNIPVLTLTALPSSVIQLDWTVPNSNGFAITTYQIEKSVDGGTTWTSLSTLNAVTTQDTGLVNGTVYQYRILATNQIGNSAFSIPVLMTAGDIPASIASLTATTQSDTSIVLSWTAAGSNGYAVTGYKIEQSLDGVAWNTIVADTQNSSVSYTSTGLTDRTDYYFKVTGINALGMGSLGPVANAHTFGLPDPMNPPTFSSTTASTTLNWQQPYDHGSSITSYRVEILNLVNGVGNGQWLTLTSTAPSVLTNTHFNLQSNTEYQYRVVATNAYGSVTSGVSAITTFAVPTQLTATANSGSAIDVSWNASPNAVSYTVYLSLDNITFTQLGGIQTNSYQHTGLNLGQTVYYKYTITNAGGESAQSATTSATTFNVPGTTTGLALTNPHPTTARLQWSAPTTDGGDSNITYTIHRSTDGTTFAPYGTTASLAFDDTSLTALSQYYWKVSAGNSAGWGADSNTVTYTVPAAPSSPTNLTSTLVGSTNSAGTLTWGAPGSTSGYNIIGYQIERNVDGNGWFILVADTGTSNVVFTNTGLNSGSSYVYRVSGISAVGIGSPSNTASLTPIQASITITGSVTGGNSVIVSPTVSFTGGSTSNIVTQSLYKDNARDQLISLNTPLSGGGLAQMTSYPTYTSSFFVTITLDTGYVIQSNTISLTPSAPFTGEITFAEERFVYEGTTAAADCASDSGDWEVNPITNIGSCNLSYTESTLDFTVQPVGADVIIRYQPQNLNDPPIIKAFTATASQISEVTVLDRETDYYGSIYVNPEFDYTVQGNGSIVVNCDPNDILCDPTDIDVPKGTPSEKSFKSFKSPDATPQLGIEPMGDLFGINMVFIFVIAIAGIFTGRSAPMGVIFIIVTMGIMAYLGYLDFYSPDATWALLIISAILGIFIGKRWS